MGVVYSGFKFKSTEIAIDPSIINLDLISGYLPLIIAFFLNHLSVNTVEDYQKNPFYKFDRTLYFYIKSWLFPFLSISILALIIGTYFIDEKLLMSTIVFLVYSIAFSRMNLGKYYILMINTILLLLGVKHSFLLMMIILIPIDYYFSLIYLRKPLRVKKQIEQVSLFWKEYRYYRFYKSELFYVIINLAFSLTLFIIINSDFKGVSDFKSINMFLFWCNLGVIVLPTSLTMFNVLGMESKVLVRLKIREDLACNYVKNKVRFYVSVLYVLNIFALIYFYTVGLSIETLLRYIISLFLFNEMLFLGASIYSVLMVEEKEKKWRYGQYFFSKNNNYIPILLFSLIFFITVTNKMSMTSVLFFSLIIVMIVQIFYSNILHYCIVKKLSA
ncbi:MAG: hypothetical protein ABJK11_12580 [Balneola sp.]